MGLTRYEEGSLRYELERRRVCVADHWRGYLAECGDDDPACGVLP